jgi:hypothetical protein
MALWSVGALAIFVLDEERQAVAERDAALGAAELDVDGVTGDGEPVPVLRRLAWQR